MSHEKNRHLSEEEIIHSIVDEDDLSDELKEHLSSCSLCGSDKERLEKPLSRLGNMAVDFAPLRDSPVVLPERETIRPNRLRTWQRRSLVGAGVAVVLLLVLFWGRAPFTPYPDTKQVQWDVEAEQDEKLMTEIRWLEEHALPEIYFELAGESILGVSEEFIEFIVPSTINEAVRHFNTKEAYYVA